MSHLQKLSRLPKILLVFELYFGWLYAYHIDPIVRENDLVSGDPKDSGANVGRSEIYLGMDISIAQSGCVLSKPSNGDPNSRI